MPDPARSPLAELREVEERLAVRTARIDQLQAAVDASEARGLRFGRALVIVGSIAALATALFGFQRSDRWTLDILLASAALGLILMTGLFSLALHRFARGPDYLATALGRGFAMWIRRSWQPFSLASATFPFEAGGRRIMRPVLGLVLAVGVAAWAVESLGSVVLAGFGLVAVLGLLRAIWAGWLSAPGFVHVVAPLVAVVAALSLGTWVGGLSAGALRIDQAAPARQGVSEAAAPLHPTSADSPSRRSASGYADICGRAAPWVTTRASRSISQLREAWLSVGAVVAGCPGPVHASPGAELVVSVGAAEGKLKSLGIADPNRGTVLLGQAALATQRLTESGRDLLTVPVRLLVGGGDLYLLDTTGGTFVLARRAGMAYAVLPPGLSRLWIDAMSEAGGWLWPMRSTASSGSQGIVFVDQRAAAVASASCAPAGGACELSIDGREFLSRETGTWTSIEAVLRYAPSP